MPYKKFDFDQPIMKDTTLQAVYDYTPAFGAITYLDDSGAEQVYNILNESDFNVLYSTNTSGTTTTQDFQFIDARIPRNKVKKIAIGNATPNISNYFAMNCTALTEFSLPPNLVSIGNRFLYGATILDCDIVFPETTQSIGDYFLGNASKFNSRIQLPSTLESIAIYFMYNWNSYNQPIEIPSSVKRIGLGFGYNNPTFNQPITIPENVEEIGSNFLYNNTQFNQPITIPESVKEIGSSFLYQCTNFNSPIIFEGKLEIGGSFLSSCTAFNQPLDLSKITNTQLDNFAINWLEYNQPISIPESVNMITGAFVNLRAMTQEIYIPDSVAEIYTTAQTLSSVANTFLYNNNWTAGQGVGFGGVVNVNTWAIPYGRYYLTNNPPMVGCYADKGKEFVSGISLKGSTAQMWKDNIPDRSSEAPYRKLVVIDTSAPAAHPLEKFKKALTDGTAKEKYPVGTLIIDHWDGVEAPLYVAQYLDDTNNESYGGAEGAILFRKYATDDAYQFNSTASYDYATSSIHQYLSTEYKDKCSDVLKSIISPIDVPYYNGSSVVSVSAEAFLMSATEVMGVPSGQADGIAWDYWKNATGFDTGSNNSNNGRIVYKRATYTTTTFWLRSRYNNTSAYVSNGAGGIASYNVTNNYNLDVAFFVPASGSSPSSASLTTLKSALADGTAKDKFPAGTEIPDTYAGNDNPLIVAQYLDSTNNSSYNGAEGVILVRKYIEPVSQVFGSSVDYTISQLAHLLNVEYLNNCSDELKGLISLIDIPYYDGSTMTNQTARWFSMSDAEVMSNKAQAVEGIGWQYWKSQTGLSSPDNAVNGGRILKNRDGTAQNVWLRSRYSSSYMCVVGTDGSVLYTSSSNSRGVLPACFISKN